MGAVIGLVFGALTPALNGGARLSNGLMGASGTSGLVAIGGLGAAVLEPKWQQVGLVTAGVGLGGALLFALASIVTANVTNSVAKTATA